jgi:hypothetical protein
MGNPARAFEPAMQFAATTIRLAGGSSGARREDAGKRDSQPLAASFGPGHTAIFSARIQAVKTIVQRESRHWMHSMNGRPPFRPNRGLLLWQDPITSANLF